MVTPNRTLKQKAYHEFKAYLFISFYIWLVLALLSLHKTVILGENHIDTTSQGFEIINALALGKVVLFGQALRLGELTPRPLIYPTLLKSAIFAVLLACFKILERWAVGVYHGLSFTRSIEEIGGGTLQGILAVTAIGFVALIPFFAFTELQKIVGEGKLARLFFHRHQPLALPSDPVEARNPQRA